MKHYTTALRAESEGDPYVTAVTQWLTGEVAGHLGPYMYVDDPDDKCWADAHSAAAYYFKKDEMDTFRLVMKDLRIQVENLFDLGPGGESSIISKSIPLLEAARASRYYPVDFSPALAARAANLVTEKRNIHSEPVVADFFEPLPLSTSNSLIAFMGGTLGNIETHQSRPAIKDRLIKLFAQFRKVVTGKSYYLVSFDSNTDSGEILSCYQNGGIERLIRGCIEKAIDITDFEYDATWQPDTMRLAMGLRSKRDQIIHFDGVQHAIEKGEFLSVLNSYRYPAEFVVDAASEAGWDHVQTWSATGRVHYQLYETKRL